MIKKNKVFLEDKLREEVESSIDELDTKFSDDQKQFLINKINYNVMK